MSNNYTPEQIRAIIEKDSNLLVSASAGSGKTTVLIERILHKIIQMQWNVDELLIVTFTEAAASELKQRLRVKISQELLGDPTNDHLRKQLPKLANASISTFHSFCNQVLKKFFYLIDFDAAYKVSDEIEAFMIAQTTLDELFEDCFEQNDLRFLSVVERFSTQMRDDYLKKLIIELFNKMRTLPFKDQFKKETLKHYDIQESLESWTYHNHIYQLINEKINEAENYFLKAKTLADEFNHDYLKIYEADRMIVENIRLLMKKSFDEVYQYLKIVSFKTFRSNSDEIDDISKETIKDFRNKGKTLITKDLKKYFNYKENSQVKFITENKKVLEDLFYVVDLFETRFSDAKRDKNLVDFSDLEELTLKILMLNQGENDAVTFYKNLYHEILIDEFQDTNSMQETIMKAISRGNNLFMVGDVKQSIYRFRSAEPEIFQAKYKAYQDLQDGKLINLNANYRSRKEILDYINFLFYQLMDEESFEITYDDKASLHFGQKGYLEKPIDEPLITLRLLDKRQLSDAKEDKVEKNEMEAHIVAQEIRNLIDHKAQVYDKSTKSLRDVQYKDIVILSRTKSDQETYNDIFKTYDIPFLSTELTGYFNSIEVLTVTSLLKIIDNPLQDIPLVASLRSPIFQVNEKELIDIKVNSQKDYFYDKVVEYVKVGKNQALIDKLSYFTNLLKIWREKIKNEPLSELIFSIYHETNYYDYVLGQVGGNQRQANLDLLFERAKSYEHLISNSLFKFIQLINFLNENDKDLNQARTLSDNEDMVRFMSIHKSKGLEFPIVFVTNLNKDYNTQDEKNSILFDKDLGISFSYYDTKNRVKYNTLYETVLKDKMHKQMLAEELRLLYVALTRAKERLFLIGTVKDFREEAKKLAPILKNDEILLPRDDRQQTNYLSLILLGMARHPQLIELLSEKENKRFIKKLDIPNCDIKVIDDVDEGTVEFEKDSEYDLDFSKYMHDFSKRLNFIYPHYEKTTHYAKQTIADMKRANQLSEYEYQYGNMMLKKPKLIGDAQNATLRGTSYHLFMQHIDYTKAYTLKDLETLKTKLITNEIMNEEQAEFIELSKVMTFLNHEISQKIKDAHTINTEMPFTTLMSSHTVYQDLKDDVDILVQGVVDLFVEYDDCCVLIDFKSDRVKNTTEDINKLKKQYGIQIEVYKQAMQNIYQKPVKAVLYLIEIDKFIDM